MTNREKFAEKILDIACSGGRLAVNKATLEPIACNRMKNIVSRTDVTRETVIELRKKGFTISGIAKELHCGYNTVCRRLGMKS